MPNTNAVRTAQVGAAPFFAGKNAIINGDFRINQRNFTSITQTSNYCFDRFYPNFNGGTVTTTPQTFTPGAAPVSGYEAINFVQVVTASQSASNHYAIFAQAIEDARTLAGQTVTMSFWAKTTSGTPSVVVELAQNFGTGGSPSSEVSIPATKTAISTSWSRYSFTVSVPSVSGKTFGTNNDSKLYAYIWISAGSDFAARTNSLGVQNGTFQIWGVQVEAGSVATTFETATGTLAGELAACQRYYVRFNASGAYSMFANGFARSSVLTDFFIRFPVTMRIAPTSMGVGGSPAAFDGNTFFSNTLAINLSTETTNGVGINGTGTGMTANRPYILLTNGNTATYLDFSAEL